MDLKSFSHLYIYIGISIVAVMLFVVESKVDRKFLFRFEYISYKKHMKQMQTNTRFLCDINTHLLCMHYTKTLLICWTIKSSLCVETCGLMSVNKQIANYIGIAGGHNTLHVLVKIKQQQHLCYRFWKKNYSKFYFMFANRGDVHDFVNLF